MYIRYIYIYVYVSNFSGTVTSAPVSRGSYLEPAGVAVYAREDQTGMPSEDVASLVRDKRGHHHLPIWVNTFQMTDHHANFKWGVRHNVGH